MFQRKTLKNICRKILFPNYTVKNYSVSKRETNSKHGVIFLNCSVFA